MRILKLEITDALAGRKILSLLRNELCLSSGLTARVKLIENGITLNGKPARTNETVKSGDTLCVVIGHSGEHNADCTAMLPILYEDDDILIIDKPAGAAVHGSRYDDNVESIEACVNKYYGNQHMFHPVSRLDKGTSGIMTIAKNGYMHERLAALLHSSGYKRIYLGIADGELATQSGTVNLPIGRVDGSAIKRCIRDDGAIAVTHYQVLSSTHGHSLLEFRLETGRTHQIRLHMSAIGHPLTGDWLYGTENRALITRPALHSSRLEFTHPLSNKKITISCGLPQDMAKLISDFSLFTRA